MSDAISPLHCPFCGSVHISSAEGATFRSILMECRDCGAKGPETRMGTIRPGTRAEWLARGRIDATREWNKRAHAANPERL